MQKLRAGASTSVQKLGASIHICLSQDGDCLVSVVGPNALNQAIKGIIVARSLLLNDDNSDLVVQPNFVVVQQNSPKLETLRLHQSNYTLRKLRLWKSLAMFHQCLI